ncbi:MAG TPA: hypothetical protein VK252_00985 [Solirubrobacteraceae bacterium]|nr:hypothetical protein [Solirubrobacteraceae bacterium]
MSARHTRRAAAAAGNPEPLLVEDLASASSWQLQRERGLDGVVLEDADVSTWEASSVRLAEVALRRVDDVSRLQARPGQPAHGDPARRGLQRLLAARDGLRRGDPSLGLLRRL